VGWSGVECGAGWLQKAFRWLEWLGNWLVKSLEEAVARTWTIHGVPDDQERTEHNAWCDI
jgi:hypothetical protein